MKKIIFTLLCVLFIILVVVFYITKTDKIVEEKPKIETKKQQESIVKVVFFITNKNIDFEKMDLDKIIEIIKKDSLLEINGISVELKMEPQIIKVYRIEDITCPYLKKRFKNNKPGELVYEYNDKILVKLNDGVIKVFHTHEETFKK
jgi:hypothetical protein